MCIKELKVGELKLCFRYNTYIVIMSGYPNMCVGVSSD